MMCLHFLSHSTPPATSSSSACLFFITQSDEKIWVWRVKVKIDYHWITNLRCGCETHLTEISEVRVNLSLVRPHRESFWLVMSAIKCANRNFLSLSRPSRRFLRDPLAPLSCVRETNYGKMENCSDVCDRRLTRLEEKERKEKINFNGS